MSEPTSSTARVAWTCAAALAVFVVWVALGSASSLGIAFFYLVPIGLATWWGGPRIGVATLLLCGALYVLGDLIHPVQHFGLALAIRAIVFAAAVALITLLRDRMQLLEHASDELEAIREALTPTSLPNLANVDAAAAFVPSEHGVSGDFYLLTNGPDGSTVAIVGDVTGHGPDAARMATFIRARFAAFAANTSDPAELLTLANQALVDRPGPESELVSAVCLRFHTEDEMLSSATAGHPLPLQLPGLQELQPEGETRLLGVDSRLSLTNAKVSLSRPQGVVVYTDGATDVRCGGNLLGLDGLLHLLAPIAGLPAKAAASRIQQAVLEWTDEPIRDDLCVRGSAAKAEQSLA